MRDIDLEEGEAYLVHDYDDDENIDPDRDLSYIDKKIENVLGQYQKDFMGGISAETLGARFGGYGSFLPMQQRSPSALSGQRGQSHVSSKSSQNLPSEQPHPHPTGAANNSFPVKPLSGSSANGTEAVSQSGALPMDNLLKLQDASESASNKQQKEPMPQYAKQNSLKLRVKMPADNALPYDKSAIYSGLGLDISPSSSPEDGHSDSDSASPGGQVKMESPYYIVEIMTTLPLPNGELLSPLHDSWVHLTMKENNVEISIPASEGKKEASNARKPKVKDSSKDKKIKKELRKERKSKEQHQNMSHVEPMTGNYEYPLNGGVLSMNGKGTYATSEGRQLTSSKPSIYDKKVNAVSASASSYAASAVDVNTSSGRTQVNQNDISVSREEFSMDKKNEDETNKFQKQGSVKDKVKERVLSTVGPKQDKVYRKGYETAETTSTDKEAGLFSMNDVSKNDKNDDSYEEMKDCNTPEHSTQKTHVKVMLQPQVEAGVSSGESLLVGPSAKEIGVAKSIIPSKSKKGESDLRKEIKKDYKVPTNVVSSKKGKEASLKDFEMRVPKREIPISPNKQKEKSSYNRKEIAAVVAPSIAGGLTGGNGVENMPVVNSAPAEIVPHDDWVQCDKCHKWRLLPLEMDPESLPKVWKCSMLTWLPGKNKCSVSEEETNAVYQPLGPTQLQNNQLAYPNVGAFVGASGDIPHVGVLSQTSNINAIASGTKRRDLPKTDLDDSGHSGFQDTVPVKQDQIHSSEFGARNPKKLPRDPSATKKTGDAKPSKLEKKRGADFEGSGVPKKAKRVYQPSIGNLDPASLSTVEAKGESVKNDLGPVEIAKDYGKRSVKASRVKVKDGTQNSVIAKNSEIRDSGKKRKLKDRAESTTSLGCHPGRVQQHEMKNSVNGKNDVLEPREERKERKSKGSNFQGREGSSDKTNSRTHSDGGRHNLGSSCNNSHHKKGRQDNIILEECHADKGSQRVPNVRNSTEKALDFGLSDNATTSSSSKVSRKGKAKASEVKSSPVGSISSSPFRLSKCDSDKGTSKMPASYKESDELSSSKQLKSRADNEFPTHGEEIRDRKSNLSRSYGADATVDNTSLRKKSAGKCSGAHITEDFKDASFKLDHRIEDSGASTSRHNLVSGDQVAKSSNSLHVNGADSRRSKVHDMPIGSEKETSYHSYGVSENEQANGSYATNVDNVRLRHTQATAQSSDIELSVKKGSSHRAAKTALKEATNLKHSANRLKISGSTIESTEVFFQAALKFLHGASLMEPVNIESGRGREMASTEVYSTTATLCEYCAREYERGNNLASAALAYKCMEVAYMRVVYCNDLVASRDRMELQVAIRTVPQVESPSSSASDVDNLNNQVAAMDTMKDGHSGLDHRAHVISAENRPSFSRVLNFTEDINRAMEASRRSQIAFRAASPILTQAGKHVALSSIKTVLDFSFHDVQGFLHLVRLAMEALGGV